MIGPLNSKLKKVNYIPCSGKAGAQAPHGCLAGSCGSCRILILEGEDALQEPGYIESDTIKRLKETYSENTVRTF